MDDSFCEISSELCWRMPVVHLSGGSSDLCELLCGSSAASSDVHSHSLTAVECLNLSSDESSTEPISHPLV
ncbi:hypothetical protein AOLI_G00274680 [Acnodon oligacanthus]